MTAWLVRATKEAVETSSPRDMAKRYGGTWVDANGKAVSNALGIWQPDLSAVVGQPSIYWKLTGDVVNLMSRAERDAVDAALIRTAKDTARAVAKQTFADDLLSRAIVNVFNSEDVALAKRSQSDVVAAINAEVDKL